MYSLQPFSSQRTFQVSCYPNSFPFSGSQIDKALHCWPVLEYRDFQKRYEKNKKDYVQYTAQTLLYICNTIIKIREVL